MNQYFYSASSNGFYVLPYFSGKLPADAKQISPARYSILIRGQRNDMRVVPGEDGLPTTVSVSELPDYIMQVSKQNRQQAVAADLYVDSLQASFQYDKEGKAAIFDTITESLLLGAKQDDAVLWRLANNSWRSLTLLDLQNVARAGALRRRDVWSQFAEWDDGPKITPFEYTRG